VAENPNQALGATTGYNSRPERAEGHDPLMSDHPCSAFDLRSPGVLDLFSGCGGISLGFHRAGFKVIGGVEMSAEAARTHAENFHPDAPPALKDVFARPRDIRETDPHALLAEFGYTGPVDVIVGGPPCQAYARVGRAKLREVMDHPDAFTQDDRGNLYLHYLRFVAALRPLALLMENVPDILNYGGKNVAEEISENLEELGYRARYTLLNAAHYGVPQMRERFFLIAVREDVATLPANPFPAPSHRVSAMPVGYQGTRAVATKVARKKNPGLFDGTATDGASHLLPPGSAPSNGLPEAVTAEEALGDLPAIREHLEGKLRRGARRFTKGVPYRPVSRLTDYAREMREWPGFESLGEIKDHAIRSLPRDYAIFRRMAPGDQYPQAHALAERMFGEAVDLRRRAGDELKEGTEAWTELRKAMVPPYDATKFPNKWRKLEADKPARTLMAHLGKDSYSHIHYDDNEARTISVREAARLQSFPDGFRFSGTMNPAFRQVGNAVPPKIAYALATSIRLLIAPALAQAVAEPFPERE
jgi:DNA (cytosine-5)-methyltransferase 1